MRMAKLQANPYMSCAESRRKEWQGRRPNAPAPVCSKSEETFEKSRSLAESAIATSVDFLLALNARWLIMDRGKLLGQRPLQLLPGNSVATM